MILSRKDGGLNMLKDIKDAKEISCYDALTGRYTGEEDGWQKWKDLDEDWDVMVQISLIIIRTASLYLQ